MNNLDQIKSLIKLKMEAVAIQLIKKDIYEMLDEIPLHSTKTRHGNIKLILNNKTHLVVDIVSTGILTVEIKKRTLKKNNMMVSPVFHKYEDLNPLQLWLLAYIYIPKLAKMEHENENI